MIIAITYIIFFAFTVSILLRKNLTAGFVYIFLFIYSIFSYVGYKYFPGMSESIQAYFGPKPAEDAITFIFASMILIFLANFIIYKKKSNMLENLNPAFYALFPNSASPVQTVFYAAFCLLYASMLFALRDEISWIQVATGDISIFVIILISLYKISVGVIIFTYSMFRSGPHHSKKFYAFFLSVTTILFSISSAQLGNRTDPLALMIGVMFFESITRNLTTKRIIQYITWGVIGIVAISAVEIFRYDNTVTNLADKIIMNDYFAPAHTLFAAIAYNYTDPLEVIRSNFFNFLIGFDYPLIQYSVTELFNPGVTTRNASYAFYILTEGYIFSGFFGIIYNAIVVTVGIYIWNKMTLTNNKLMNAIILSMMVAMAANMARTQSIYYIRYIYLYFLPAFFLSILFSGVRIGIARQPAIK